MKTILIVDDDNSLRMLMCVTLEGKKFRVVQAENGMEAIISSQMERPDLIILDLMMPELSGLEALKTMKEKETTMYIPVIILTAKHKPEDKEKALEMGANHFLYKPFSPQELLDLVVQFLK
ncbi:MAG: PleD family two-component system response regulator [Nitrospiria bacterium]